MHYKEVATENYRRFCKLEGCDYIASEFALQTILKLIESFKITSVLELGLGIGSVSDTVFKYVKSNHTSLYYAGTELNDFCLKSLPNNVENYSNLSLFPELKNIKNEQFEFIIVDGYDNSFDEIKHYCLKNTILYIEGDRSPQTKKIIEIFPKNLYVNVITLKKNPPYAHEGRSIKSYIGGGQLIFTNPTLKMRLYWFKAKITTYLKIKIRQVNQIN